MRIRLPKNIRFRGATPLPFYIRGYSTAPTSLQKNTQTSITGSSVFAPTVFLGNQCSSINVSFGDDGGIVIRNVGGVITTASEVGNLSNPEQVLQIIGFQAQTITLKANW